MTTTKSGLLEITATMTNGPAPPSYAAAKTANFAVKPLVNGIPASASKKKAKTEATTGDFLPRPAHCDR